MRQIRRIPIAVQKDTVTVAMSMEARIIGVEHQGDGVYLNVLEVKDQPQYDREIRIVRTGVSFDWRGTYLGSAGSYHLFER